MKEKRYTIGDFLKVKVSGGGKFSFDDTKIAYRSNKTGTFQIYIKEVDGKYDEQVTDFEDNISGFIYSPKEDLIIFSKAEKGNENSQLFKLNPNTKEIVQITNNSDIRYDLSSFSYDGSYISYASNERNGKDFDIYLMNVTTQKEKMVFSLGGRSAPIGFSPSGKYLVIRKTYSLLGSSDLYLCNIEDESIKHLTHEKEKSFYMSPRWLDESNFFIITNKDSNFFGLAKYSLDKEEFKYVLQPNWDINNLTMSKDAIRLIVTVNEDGYDKVSIYDSKTLEKLPDLFPENGYVGGISFSNNSKNIIFSHGDSRTTTDMSLIILDKKVIYKFTDSEQNIEKDVMVEPELIYYKSFDGLEIPAFVYKPRNIENKVKVPVIIDIHGGPESQYRPTLNRVTQYFVCAGYMVVAPNIRGSTGYGKEYASLDNLEKRMDSVKDIVELRNYLETVPGADTNKVVVMGGSYGGFMVLACLAFYPKLWAGGIDFVGIVNFVTFMENTAPYRRAIREAEYGSLENHRELLESISPINSIENVEAPLMVVHGANDPRVPLSEAEQVVSKLKELNRKVEFIVYEDEGHGLKKLKNRLDVYPKVVEFLDEILK